MDESVFDKIFSAAAGVWALVCMAAVALFKAWPSVMERLNERKRDSAAEKAGDWERIRAERDHWHREAEKLSALLAECERISIERLGRAVIAEAELIGRNKLLNRATMLPGASEADGK